MRLTTEQYQAILARRIKQPAASADAVDKEDELHAAIIAECKRRGWLAFYGSMVHATHRPPGEPDFIILADGGQKLLVEAKTKTGKLSNEQLGVIAHAAKLGHCVSVVRSMSDFQGAVATLIRSDK